MRCNACISMEEKDHKCIQQTLGGDCSICMDTLFDSTKPLKKLRCGHVMHLECYTQFCKTTYKCPICKKSMEDMSDYFALIDRSIER